MTLDRLRTCLAERYGIERELGQGGMATVYLADDLKHQRKVAIKVLRPELAAVIGAERFLSEIRTTANLQHPHILPLFDSGVADSFLFYVMPFVEGESLRDRLTREKQLPIADAVRIAGEVASALDYAHRHGVIHRDIKPENILLHDGRALVADFGIALAASKAGGTRMTETGMSLGTPTYMSPEQAMGERDITGRSDVYALGCVLYEMLVGEPPFTGPTAQAIVARIVTEEPRRLSGQRKSVPPYLEAAVQTALQKLPADRFATAAEFGQALSGDGARRGTGGTASAAHSAISARPLTSALFAVSLLFLGAAVIVWRSRRPAEPDAVVRFSVTLTQGVVALTRSGTGTTTAISPDGTLLVFAGTGPDGIQRLYARRLDEELPHPVSGTDGGGQPFFSPDGKSLGFWADGRLQKVAPEGGTPQTICDTPEPFGATWSASGTIVLGGPRGLFVVPAVGGILQPLAPADSLGATQVEAFPVALPDGDHVLFAHWGPGGLEGVRLASASLASRRKIVLDVAGTAPVGVREGYLIYARPDRNLWAVAFDVGASRVSGAPIAIANNIISVGARGGAKVTLSATGTLAYVADNARESRLVLTRDGLTTTPVLEGGRSFLFPRFSPDGKRIAVTIATDARSDVWLFDLASETPVRLSGAGTTNERAEWTPDGRRVLFRSDASGRSAIWWRPADLSGPATILLGGQATPYFEAVVTPDGRRVVYQADTTGGDIGYRLLAGDTTPGVVTATHADENMPRLSPDGRWVAFETNESGAAEVVVQPFPGPGGRVQVSVGGGTEPVWSRDGRRLFYRGGGKFMAAAVTTAEGFRVTSRTALFDDTFIPAPAPHANYDVSPDGSRFLLIRGVGDAAQLVVVHHWIAELERRVRGGAQ